MNRSKKGFTLMELLIVVAIIAVLAVIAFPVMKTSITKAGDAANLANMRAARAVAATSILLNEGVPTDEDYFDTVEGKFVSGKPSPTYGKTGLTPGTGDQDGKVIQIDNIVVDTGAFDLDWV